MKDKLVEDLKNHFMIKTSCIWIDTYEELRAIVDVYNALAEVNNQRGTVAGAGQNVNLKIDGFGLIDSSTLSELARMLAPYLGSNNKNIANINFSI